jgi:hypothetical protein
MARFYANENFPLQVVRELRNLGHDVLTSLEAGKANQSIPDDEVLRFAVSQHRALLTQNRRDFLKLHNLLGADHSGIVLCTADPDFSGQANRINAAIERHGAGVRGALIRVNRSVA